MVEFSSFLRNWTPDSGECLVIGEVAQAHDGSLGMAHAFIDAIANAGAQGVKFQTHIAAAESTPGEPWRVKFSQQDASRYDYWRRMEFGESQWRGLKAHADERGLLFLSSPFSVEAVELLARVGVCAWKIASGEVGSVSMIERMALSRLPFLLSTGMSPWAEIDAAVARIRATGQPAAVLQCTTAYPCQPENVGLNVLGELERRYGLPVGLSDHSGTIYPGLAAAALGCAVLEVHVTLSREMFGPDVPASLTPHELKQLTEGVRFIGRMRANPVSKDERAEELKCIRRVFGKSIVARRDLQAGILLQPEDVAMKKPGNGLSEDQLSLVLGRRLKAPVRRDQPILTENLM
jgi:N-acetylneuraminate synthase